LDSVGGPILSTLLPLLRIGARVIAYGVQERAPAPITNAMLIYSNLTWIGFGIDRWLATLAAVDRRVAVESLWSMVRDRTMPLPIAATFDLADFRSALATDAQSGRVGKVLLI
jgi:NADPH:quinone reductase-like Zn-dependent oxidoreductase